MNISVPVGHEVSAVSFAFYTSEQLRCLSVKALNNPTTFDPISNHPNPGGVYDPVLGASDRHDICATCKLPYASCPGHFGHIELAAPVYHPLLFKTLCSLLRATCLYCHSFKMRHATVHRYYARFKLLHAGLVFESMELEQLDFGQLMAAGVKAASSEDTSNGNAATLDTDAIIAAIDAFVERAFQQHSLSAKRAVRAPRVTLTNAYMHDVIKEFLAKIARPKKCENCGGAASTFRVESHSKIFEVPLSSRTVSLMEAKGLRRKSLFGDKSKVDVADSDDELDAGDVDDADDEVGSSALPADGNDSNQEEDQVVAEEAVAVKHKAVFMTSVQVREHIRGVWSNERITLDLVFGSRRKGANKQFSSSPEMFFMDVIPVSPTKFRPMSRMGDRVYDNPQNGYLIEIIKHNNSIVDLRRQETQQTSGNKNPTSTQEVIFKQIISHWVSLQESANNLTDSTKNPRAKMMPPGIKQILEKKEGLFRKHMMGKRVNYAARSVISPDPMIQTSEIGIPMVFAKKLTFPEPVTQYNVKEMRQAVENGPDKYPGAVAVENEDGVLTMLQYASAERRVALANQLLTPAAAASSGANGAEPAERLANINKKVHRHLRNGDMLLLNRQPTLHKPSIMGHTARILPGEKTIRMHYANCNTYNADFDGDEMNVHFPQNYIAQAEARLIANTNNQYLVPTSGEPLRGLIQDHVVTGVRMTARDTFVTRDEYTQLVFGALPESPRRILLLPPAIMKPTRLWTGKQVISTILKNLTVGQEPLNLESKSQVPGRSWSVLQAKDTEESDVVVMDGDLVTGVLDKKQFGAKPYGLVHACYEVYGSDIAGQLLTTLGRLFTGYTQMIGFTCRMDDLVLLPEADKARREKIDKALASGREILKEFAFSDENDVLEESEREKLMEANLKATVESPSATQIAKANATLALKHLEEKRLYRNLEHTIRSDEKVAQLDNKMKSKTGQVTTDIVKTTIPNGLLKPFPDNGMQLMTVSGAKGSNVNVTQISCMLGQQELEGRRVPVMVSGKTLPSFRAYDLGPRAGGYITGRFLTGIKPQEYYFHCMAGREGLVDTAVKTARSGYLQRCLIKHLEGLKVNYDYTVRDSADGSVLQFHYGEDSLDVIKASYLEKFKFNAMNYHALVHKYNPKDAAQALDCKTAAKYQRKALRKPSKYEPALNKYSPSRFLGSVSEMFQTKLNSYVDDNKDGAIATDDEDNTPKVPSDAKKPKGMAFEALMHLKYLHSLIEPGEAVGLLAAQSIGEPSTQMTLNTFHFAGHGAKNVTLGIPRLREIIMTASEKPKTPQMTIPFHRTVERKAADRLCMRISKLTLNMLTHEAVVTERILPLQPGDSERYRSYSVRLNFIPRDQYQDEYDLAMKELQSAIAQTFVKKLVSHIRRDLKGARNKEKEEESAIGQGADMSRFKEVATAASRDDGDGAEADKPAQESDDDASINGDVADSSASVAKELNKRKQQSSYDDSEDEEAASDKDGTDDDETGLLQLRDEIVNDNEYVHDYEFDSEHGAWCQLELRFPLSLKKMLMVSLVEKVAPLCVIREVPGITKCFVNENKEDNRLYLVTEGVNIRGMWTFDEYLDLKNIRSNDIALIKNTYGVEAARSTIINEISGVFAVYGIDVDKRHLSLIADYMTFEGGYKPFSRRGIENSASPFAKMTFETTFHFLTDASLHGGFDALRNPSARLVMGKVVEGGTGSFEVMQPLDLQ